MAKSLFDHIKQITDVQSPNYWDEITDNDKKSWSNYMVNRFLSMKMDWIDIVNEVQKYNLEPEILYKLYTNIFPKGKQWLKYTKGDKMKYPKEVYEYVAKYLQVSMKEAEDAVEVYEMSEGGIAELKDILMKYGKTEQECHKLGL
jgi:translation initiation factor 2 alpha subunit (eIF-2alpha)|tara:strand:+ start:218 stop:652 length:435 start_codon:yes stop_codon:yes gene_type:complete